MAVDRSKFRTCQQTSFCRRHRHGKSKALYDYRVVGESVGMHRENTAADTPDNADTAASGGGILSKFSRKLMGGGDTANAGDDTHIRGPSPIFTARLTNTAPFTSSSLTAQAYGNGNCDAIEEELNLAVHLHEDGVARIRITEVLEGGSAVRSTPRWTSDELVLNEDEMIGVGGESVRAVSTDAAIMGKLSPGGRGAGSEGAAEEIVSSLTKRANIAEQDRSLDNFVVLSYDSSCYDDYHQQRYQRRGRPRLSRG